MLIFALGAVHKGRPQIFPYFCPLPPSCLQPSAFQGPLQKRTSVNWEFASPRPFHFHVCNIGLFRLNFE